MNIFKLVGSVYVDTAEANKSIAKTDNQAVSLAKKFASGAKSAAKFGGAIVAGATAAVGAMTALVTSQLSSLDAIDKTSKKLGMSAKEYQEWDYIMRQSGTDISVMQSGLKTLSNQMQAANSGTGKAVKNFRDLGIQIHDANGNLKSQDILMNEALYALADMDAGTEQTRLAIELFGKAGMELLPMLESGSLGLEEMKNKANDLGLVIGDDLIDQGVTLGDTIDNIKSAFSTMGTQIGGAAIPIIQQFATLIEDNIPTIRALFDGLTPVISSLMSTLLPPIMSLVQKLFPVIINLLTTLSPIVDSFLQAILPPLIEIIEAFLPPLMDIINAVLPVIVNLLKLVAPILSTILSFIAPIVELIADILRPVLNWLSKFLSDTLAGSLDFILEMCENLQLVFGGLIKFIKGVFSGDWEAAWEGIKDIFKGIFNSLPAILEFAINGVIKMVNGLVDGVNKVTGLIGIPEIPDIPEVKLPRFAKGGIVEGPTTALIGEDGAEAVVPLEKNREWISGVAKEMDVQLSENGKLLSLLQEISDKLDNMDSIINVKLVPDNRRLFDVIREESVKNAKMGGRPITV